MAPTAPRPPFPFDEPMNTQDRIYSVPTLRFTRWLVDPGRNVPPEIRVALVGGLFGSLPIFFGGIINTLLVAALITLRRPEPPFLLWLRPVCRSH